MAITKSYSSSPFARTRGVITAAVVVAALVITSSAEATVELKPEALEVTEDSGDALTAPDSISASMHAKLSGVEVEDLGQRTETTSVFALPDGTWRADIAAGPVWVETGEDPTTEEGWEQFDATLGKFSDGSIRAGAHPNDVVLSGGGPGKVLIAAATDSQTGHTLEMWWTLPVRTLRASSSLTRMERSWPMCPTLRRGMLQRTSRAWSPLRQWRCQLMRRAPHLRLPRKT